MKKGFRILSIIVLVVGIISFSRVWAKRQSDTEPMRSYVAIFFEAETTPDGQMTVKRWRTKYVKANGESRTVLHGADAAAAFSDDSRAFNGTSLPVFTKTSEGFFAKSSSSNERKEVSGIGISETAQKLFHSHSFLRNRPQFVRTDKVAGLPVYVIKVFNQETPDYWTEISHSPLTGENPLRIVSHQPDGTLFTLEAVRVDFREVPDNLNDDVTVLPNTGKLGDKTKPAKNPNSN